MFWYRDRSLVLALRGWLRDTRFRGKGSVAAVHRPQAACAILLDDEAHRLGAELLSQELPASNHRSVEDDLRQVSAEQQALGGQSPHLRRAGGPLPSAARGSTVTFFTA